MSVNKNTSRKSARAKKRVDGVREGTGLSRGDYRKVQGATLFLGSAVSTASKNLYLKRFDADAVREYLGSEARAAVRRYGVGPVEVAWGLIQKKFERQSHVEIDLGSQGGKKDIELVFDGLAETLDKFK